MALVPASLASQIEAALKKSQADSSPASQSTLAQDLSNRLLFIATTLYLLYSYLILYISLQNSTIKHMW